jgi:hypothetical protein
MKPRETTVKPHRNRRETTPRIAMKPLKPSPFRGDGSVSHPVSQPVQRAAQRRQERQGGVATVDLRTRLGRDLRPPALITTVADPSTSTARRKIDCARERAVALIEIIAANVTSSTVIAEPKIDCACAARERLATSLVRVSGSRRARRLRSQPTHQRARQAR